MEKLYKLRRQGTPLEKLGLDVELEDGFKSLGIYTVEGLYGILPSLERMCRSHIPPDKLKQLDELAVQEYAMGLLMEAPDYDS